MTQTGKEAQNSGPERELATHEATEARIQTLLRTRRKALAFQLQQARQAAEWCDYYPQYCKDCGGRCRGWHNIPSEAAEDCLERANKKSKKMWEKDPEWFGGPTFEQWTNKMKTQYQSSCHQAYHEKRNAQ